MLPIIRSRTVKRFSFGAKPAEGTHDCTNCGPPRAEASARRSLRDRIDQAMCDLWFGLLSFGPQLAKGRDGYEAGLRQGEAAARRWLPPSPFGHGIAGSVRSRADGRAIKESSPPPAGGCGMPHNMCELPNSPTGQSIPTRRCRPPPNAADGTRRSNGVPRQDRITRSIDCSVFLFGQRHKSPSREPRYGFRLFAMIFKTSLAELVQSLQPVQQI